MEECMFDTIVKPSTGVPRQRWTTTAVSAIAHTAVMIVLVLSTMYATDVLPEPREAITFVVPVAPPPPPPPAPPAVERAAPKVQKAVTPRPAPVVTKAPIVAAPVQAPDTITPETGLEGGEFDIDPGFERGVAGGVIGGMAGGLETAAPLPPPAAPVRVGGEVSAPRLIERVEPEYPALAVAAQVEGMVILEATVDRRGSVADARVLRSHGVLDEAALAAVRQWRYEPLLLNGKPTPFILTVTLSFSLSR
jgi:protein TonB